MPNRLALSWGSGILAWLLPFPFCFHTPSLSLPPGMVFQRAQGWECLLSGRSRPPGGVLGAQRAAAECEGQAQASDRACASSFAKRKGWVVSEAAGSEALQGHPLVGILRAVHSSMV